MFTAIFKGGIFALFQEKAPTSAETDTKVTEDGIAARFQPKSAADNLRRSSLSRSQESLVSLTPSTKSAQSTTTKTTTISSNDSAHMADAVSSGNAHCETNQLKALSSRTTRAVEQLDFLAPAPLKLERFFAKQILCKTNELEPQIWGLSYNSARDEMFLADYNNNAVRSMRLRNNNVDVRDVVSGTEQSVYSVCFLSDSQSDTLLVCVWEQWQGTDGNWLVALVRNGSEWREAHRVPIAIGGLPKACCALSDSRVLLGSGPSHDLELFGVHGGRRIAHISRIHAPDTYRWFAATTTSSSEWSASDALVALSHEASQAVSVHRLVGDRLEALALVELTRQVGLLHWINDRVLIAQEEGSKTITELEFSGTQLACRREIDACKVGAWCAAGNELAIVDTLSHDLLHYSFINK